jgi:hypothetical protein
MGGSGSDSGNGIAVDSTGCAYVTGRTDSTDFPTKNAYQGSIGGGFHDAFVTKIRTNEPPTADASPDQTVDEGATVTLDASSSSDLDDGIASYLWTQTAGTSVTLSDTTAVQPTFIAPNVDEEGEALSFQLTVTDNGGLQDSDTCIVNITHVDTDDGGGGDSGGGGCFISTITKE